MSYNYSCALLGILGFNSPCEFGVPICLWVAAQLGVLKDLNNQVSKWCDFSINSRDFAQATALQQPIYEMNGINGLFIHTHR